MSQYINMGARAIIRPPRCTYPIDSLPESIQIPGCGNILRHSINFVNSRGYNIVGSYYFADQEIADPSCIIYLHGNASCQLEGAFLVPIFVPVGVSVVCLDFSGCGHSEGEYVSLGLLESDDVTSAISWIRAHYGIKRVALWGRSMGAATSFFAITQNPAIQCAVVDSPFASLPDLVKELASQIGIPGCFTSSALWMISNKVKSLAGFDIRDVQPELAARESKVPILIIHGKNDDFINCSHSERLYEAYAGTDKKVILVKGDHNSNRPNRVVTEAIMMIARILDAPIVENDISDLITNGDAHFNNIQDMMEHVEDEE